MLKCLEKDPDRRYATARELAADLQHFLRGQPVSARPVGDLERTWRWCRRNPLVSSLLAAVVVVVVCGLIGVSWKWHDAEANLTRALAAEQRAGEQRRHAEESRYAADMHLAAQAVDDGDLGRAVAMLKGYVPSSDQPDLRGFEWRSLAWRCWGQSRTTYRGYKDEAWAVAISSDGGRLAVGGGERSVSLLDITNGHETKLGEFPLPPESGGAMSLAFSSNGKTLLAATGGSNDVNAGSGAILLWDVDSKTAH